MDSIDDSSIVIVTAVLVLILNVMLYLEIQDQARKAK